ncbi:putative feruloyl esterase-like protein [Phaeoacremonium minimum UCRPA7]|uniref:Putative feruloyl esterase-like protein n=1 Tax=Phaeoacremonium minimum (strain UCR-PA7) TaxID=1286976 RepID=R8BCF2_PHAM7|nr:putative feruloyl esterase-like protein [Phaeoacremonium minimum UCRPA7]EON96960.1 putative feruloyl esterase-like protein [Phaeoacremonium minimum UCRPA7]
MTATTVVPESLTVVITTSPTPSAPSIDLVSLVVASFRKHCPVLLACRVIVIFDSYDHVVPKARLKKGQVTQEVAKNYDIYKENVKDFILSQFAPREEPGALQQGQGEAEYGSPMIASNVVAFKTSWTADKHVTFIEPSARLGFGLAVRSALRMLETPYVWIHQHDWALLADIPVDGLLEVMQDSKSDKTLPVNYVCFPSVRMLSYAETVNAMDFPALKALTISLRREFAVKSRPEVRIPLTPIFFWHDKPHIACAAHYLARAFPSRLAMPRGAFIEDTIGQRARHQMKDGNWHKWACWLYYPDDGKRLCLRHLQGRTWKGKDAEQARKDYWQTYNADRLSRAGTKLETLEICEDDTEI